MESTRKVIIFQRSEFSKSSFWHRIFSWKLLLRRDTILLRRDTILLRRYSMEDLVASVTNARRQLLESYRINRLRGMFSEANLTGNPHKMGKKELIDHLMSVAPSPPKVETSSTKEIKEIRDEIDTLMKELTIDELRALRDRLQRAMDSPEETPK